MGFQIAGVDFHRPLKLGKPPVQLPLFQESMTEVAKGVRIERIDLQGLLVLGSSPV